MAEYSLSKKERLTSKKHIELLFAKGKSIYKYPVKCMYLKEQEINVPVKVAVTVPKRIFKRAVDRNMLKRRLRESYRKHKNIISRHDEASGLILMLIYVSRETEDSSVIEKAVAHILSQM